MRRPLGPAAVTAALVAALVAAPGAAPARAAAETVAAPLQIAAVTAAPERPAAGSLVELTVRIANRGTRPASRLRFRVTADGEELTAYRDRLDLAAVPPGGAAEVRLYNLWTDPSACPGCADGAVEVRVELIEARWIEVGRAGAGVPVEGPAAAVPGLPSSAAATVRLEGAPAKASPASSRGAAAVPPAAGRSFTEVSKRAGIAWRHHRSVFDPRLERIMSWMGSIHAGCAIADFDGDGDQDLYFLDSLAGEPNVLYRNDGGLRFTEVGAAVGAADLNDAEGVSMDAIFVDVDRDGDQDLVIAGYGRNRLLLNERGRFIEAPRSGLDHRGNAAAVIAFDLEGDGLLELMVGNYFDDFDLWNIPHTKILQTSFETARNGGRDLLYRNLGGGRFAEAGAELGVDDPGWTLALGAGDLDGDGDPDVYVANDFGPDLVYRNDGGKLVDVTAEALGPPDKSAGMNVDLGDYDNDGLLDVYVTNIVNEVIQQGNMLWRNLGGMKFVDVAVPTESADGGWGWGAKFLDYDNDGDLDIYTVNGYVSDGPVDIFRGPGTLNRGDVSDVRVWPDMRGLSLSGYEPSRLFRNDALRFTEVARQAGVASIADGRGVATGDLDHDGALDLLVCNSGSSPELYRNEVGAARPWLAVELAGTASNADGIGARVTVESGGRRQIRELDGGNGYSAQSSKVLHFGLGEAGDGPVDRVEVRWPSGRRQAFSDVPSRRRLRIVEPVDR